MSKQTNKRAREVEVASPDAAEVACIRSCSVWRALEVLGDTSTLLILEASWLGVRRFDGFQERTGILKALLSDRLQRLVAAEVMVKVQYSERPVRFEYRLTAKGRDMYWIALMMLRWELKWSGHKHKIHIKLHHTKCGHSFTPVPTCQTCKTEIVARDIDWKDGPGVGWMVPLYSRRRQQRNAAFTASNLMIDVVQIIGDRWASLVLRSIFFGIRRFDQIQRDSAIATNILSERLNWLVEEGVLRTQSVEGGRSEYRLTEKGIDFFPVMIMLMRWGDEHYPTPKGRPMILVHKAHRHALKPVVTCSHCNEVIEIRDVTFKEARRLQKSA